MTTWLAELRKDPIPFLRRSDNPSIRYFVRRDLLGEEAGPITDLWDTRGSRRIVDRQEPDGRWRYPEGGSKRIRSPEDYDQLETYRQLGVLVEKLGFNREHPAIRKAAAWLFAHQTREGDFRGIYGRQRTPNYSAAVMELLTEAGYDDDPRIERGFRWLLSVRQDDGGWALAFRTARETAKATLSEVLSAEPVEGDRSKPSSHLITGMVLRAFAAHPKQRTSQVAAAAGRLLLDRFFKSDYYVDRRAADFWWGVSFPFWFTDIVSAMDSLSKLGFDKEEPMVKEALRRLKNRQQADGSFDVKLLRTGDHELAYWVCLVICRVFRRLYQ